MVEKHKFFVQKENIKEVIIAKYDPMKDWQQDKKGYFLIRLERKNKEIEVGFVSNKHIITKIIRGKNSEEIYNTIIKNKMISNMSHAAYLGKELYKAELALRYGKKYVQDALLSFKECTEKIKIK
ncbi:DUF4346 domain-containing protein [archaeon]|jgi:tetrahydromethanopterin S-methyltransferase subunit A|nr:DUF4346 domain-containing protein [archaeon]MBT6824025.1 DUF4346 domain-containing protein [archaeon]MBT7107258.1 DUF4346 domain-containing protein [archaeon]MBT7297179.1 DUF4346 domain-containing protein [archaeon]